MQLTPEMEGILAANQNEAELPVVVTLARGAEANVVALGLSEARRVAPGILAASLKPDQIRSLASQGDVDGIELDSLVRALDSD